MEGDRKQSEVHAPPGAWKLLGELLEGRRRALGYRYRTQFERDRGLNKRMAADIEKAYATRINTFPTGTLRHIAETYEVTWESMLAVLKGTADVLAPASPAVPLAAGPLDADRPPPPMLNEARIAADRPYYERIMGRVDLLRGQGISDPSGGQVFPDSRTDAGDWDNSAARWDISDRAWMIADLQRRADGRDGGTSRSRVSAG